MEIWIPLLLCPEKFLPLTLSIFVNDCTIQIILPGSAGTIETEGYAVGSGSPKAKNGLLRAPGDTQISSMVGVFFFKSNRAVVYVHELYLPSFASQIIPYRRLSVKSAKEKSPAS